MVNKINLDTINEEMKKQEARDSDFFKFPVGDTRLRVLSEFYLVEQAWAGDYPNGKPVGYIHAGRPVKEGEKIDRKGWAWAHVRTAGDEAIDDIKLITMSMGLLADIGKLKQNPDYKWDKYPMPFEITVSNTGSGGDRYSLTPARQNTEVEASVMEKLNKKNTIPSIVEKIIAKQSGVKSESKDIAYPTESNEIEGF